MGIPYAEVIGDPIAHSKSPLIHKFWLEKLGIEGDFRATPVASAELPSFLSSRRQDRDWCGCSVTNPHKQATVELLDERDDHNIGAVNCVVPRAGRLTGYNTDVDGVAEALSGVELEGALVCLVGAGGAAKAILAYLLQAGAAHVAIVVRDRRKGRRFTRALPPHDATSITVEDFDRTLAATCGASLIVNASPMGMTGGPPMHHEVLDSLGMDAGPDVTVFDVVYAPAETEFLMVARSFGARGINGMPMLIGQAARAFELFFGRPAPREYDGELRELLAR